jgi:5-methylcytosine-specific restriction endonuclease McrA
LTKKRNSKVLKWVVEERDRMCMYGFTQGDPCQFGLDPHHIIPRSQGGGDISTNIITLCRKHHDMAQRNEIKPDTLREILVEVYGEQYAKEKELDMRRV